MHGTVSRHTFVVRTPTRTGVGAPAVRDRREEAEPGGGGLRRPEAGGPNSQSRTGRLLGQRQAVFSRQAGPGRTLFGRGRAALSSAGASRALSSRGRAAVSPAEAEPRSLSSGPGGSLFGGPGSLRRGAGRCRCRPSPERGRRSGAGPARSGACPGAVRPGAVCGAVRGAVRRSRAGTVTVPVPGAGAAGREDPAPRGRAGAGGRPPAPGRLPPRVREHAGDVLPLMRGSPVPSGRCR